MLFFYHRLSSPSTSVKLFVPTVLCVVLSFSLSVPLSLGVVQDVSAGLNDALLLFEVNLQRSFNQHEGDAPLWRGGAESAV